ncbi:hypothetical protein, partial [uncultured Alistipes sp.]|uniref:hypothetical protein n=1 Tax=uncultured Alistipes sp. TaxID=538949 RepID=UPI00261B8DA6
LVEHNLAKVGVASSSLVFAPKVLIHELVPFFAYTPKKFALLTLAITAKKVVDFRLFLILCFFNIFV